MCLATFHLFHFQFFFRRGKCNKMLPMYGWTDIDSTQSNATALLEIRWRWRLFGGLPIFNDVHEKSVPIAIDGWKSDWDIQPELCLTKVHGNGKLMDWLNLWPDLALDTYKLNCKYAHTKLIKNCRRSIEQKVRQIRSIAKS